jgi:hypothetical protein
MNDMNHKYDDDRLDALLRESRSAPSLPPRFQESVWHRIEVTERSRSADNFPWLEVLLQQMLRPRLAAATVAVLMLFGAWLGVREGAESARHADQARYLGAVAHSVMR